MRPISARYPAGLSLRVSARILAVVALTQAPSVADDRIVTANGTSPRQAIQRNYPGSMLSFASSSAIKRITAGVKARR